MNAPVVYALFATAFAGVVLTLYVRCLRRGRRLEQDQQAAETKVRALELDKVRLECDLQAAKDAAEVERRQWSAARDQMADTFRSLASQVLEGNTRQFLELAKTTLERESEVAKSDLERRQQSIRELVDPIKVILEKYHSQIHELEMSRTKNYAALEGEIRRVVEVSSVLSRETQALKDALKKPHVRGRWGEVQLKNCIELAGMSEYADVTFQDVTTEEDGQKSIPDMTVRMPGGHVVVVDAKTPIDAFLASLEATSDEVRHAEMLRHGRLVKDHVKKLSTKAYYEALTHSADFTVMFLPNESFLYAALESEPDLVEFALQRKILVATPPTLIGLLKVIRFGWNEEKLAENAMRISDAGKELHKRVCDFMAAYESIGRHLEKAKSEYEVGLSRLNSRVLVQARRLEKLGAKSNKDLPEGAAEEDFEPLQIVDSGTGVTLT